MATLNLFDYLDGAFALTVVIAGTIVGITIASRYFKHKQKTFLLVGIAVCGMFQAWWGASLAFIMVLLTGNGISDTLFFFLGNAFIPIFIVAWMWAISILLGYRKVWLLPSIYLIITVSFDIFLLYSLTTDPSVIGTVGGYFDAQYEPINRYYLIFVLSSILVTGLLFARESLRSEKPEIKLKGKLLAIGFISYLIAGFIDSGITLSPITLVIARSILIFCAFCMYSGFLLPERIKKLFGVIE